MKQLPIFNTDKFALVDDEDFENAAIIVHGKYSVLNFQLYAA